MTTARKKYLDAYPVLKEFIGAYWHREFRDVDGDEEGTMKAFIAGSTPEDVAQLKTDIERLLALNESPEVMREWFKAEDSGLSRLEDPRVRLKMFHDQIVTSGAATAPASSSASTSDPAVSPALAEPPPSPQTETATKEGSTLPASWLEAIKDPGWGPKPS